jgi:Antitoxin Xre/MbcA/ParS C-terminal toxin-binding domain/Antitoxin Xre-like helix-turn-helix domain
MRKIASEISESHADVTAPAVTTKAVLRAAERLDISNRVLGRILGLSEASVSRMGRGAFAVAPGDKAFELGLLFVRLFRSLDSIVGGDETVARAWLRNDNNVLGGVPLKQIETVPGLTNVLAYLDARRALV